MTVEATALSPTWWGSVLALAIRVLMGWLGLFTLTNVTGATRDASFDANLAGSTCAPH